MIHRRWLTAGPHRMHARVAGLDLPGPPAVLVHGLGVSSRYFLPTIEVLATTNPVYAPDLPGSGRSSRPRRVLDVAGLAAALGAWLDAAALDRPVLVANSLGCQIAAELAAAGRPVQGLVLVGPTVDRGARSWPRQVARWLADAPREPPTLLPVLVRDYLDAGLRRPRRTFSAALRHPIEHRLAGIAVPVVVVRGARDPIAPRRWCRELAACTPRGRFVEIAGAAHAAHFSHPQALAAVVSDHVGLGA